MPMPTSSNTNNDRREAQRFAGNVPKALASLAALSTLAYVEGAIYTKAYFSEFDALWILDEIPMATFFERSLIPLLLILFFAFLSLTGLLNIDENSNITSTKRFKAAVLVMKYGPWLFISTSVAGLTFDQFGLATAAFAMALVSVPLLLLMFASSLEFIMVLWTRADLLPDRSMIYLLFAVATLGLYLVPSQLGTNVGKRDRHPTSTLPTVQLLDDTTEYKLLYSTGERFYLFPAQYKTTYPPIEVASPAKLQFIQHGKKAEQGMP